LREIIVKKPTTKKVGFSQYSAERLFSKLNRLKRLIVQIIHSKRHVHHFITNLYETPVSHWFWWKWVCHFYSYFRQI